MIIFSFTKKEKNNNTNPKIFLSLKYRQIRIYNTANLSKENDSKYKKKILDNITDRKAIKELPDIFLEYKKIKIKNIFLQKKLSKAKLKDVQLYNGYVPMVDISVNCKHGNILKIKNCKIRPKNLEFTGT